MHYELKIKKRKLPYLDASSFRVGVTGLEPATAWSQTRNATNCATPRCTFSNADAKVQKFFDINKYFKEKSGNYISNYHFSLTCVKYN